MKGRIMGLGCRCDLVVHKDCLDKRLRGNLCPFCKTKLFEASDVDAKAWVYGTSRMDGLFLTSQIILTIYILFYASIGTFTITQSLFFPHQSLLSELQSVVFLIGVSIKLSSLIFLFKGRQLVLRQRSDVLRASPQLQDQFFIGFPFSSNPHSFTWLVVLTKYQRLPIWNSLRTVDMERREWAYQAPLLFQGRYLSVWRRAKVTDEIWWAEEDLLPGMRGL
ncbi:hypothetical protein K402DRAFT_467830 [Aulographum hederae CBS 113979]|uniref:Uncharacterized protein n=1 Tax=Aulographum hederae CBS 113979 TaxID=1176131 RepID=A0A6G1GJL3_9PEZI|nr:hypothetical protein K402DRAFT_467830 [Aulographum hederae CBS 113979]